MIVRRAHLADAPAVARVHVDSWRTSYAGIVPADFLAGLRTENREAMWRRNLENPDWRSVLLVAEDDSGEIRGFACAGPEREADPVYTGELYAIYLLPAAQGKGMGRALIQAAAGWLLAQGYPALLVWVLADNNPARRFYEAMGGRYIREKTIEIGGAPLVEVAYGWDDLHRLGG
jgi:GNAT superfamily N-acetyltransferase